METKKFINWLRKQNVFSSEKQISDCVSRVARVEREFFGDTEKNLDTEFANDKLKRVITALSRGGITPEMQSFKPNTLPDGWQLNIIRAAVAKYYFFKSKKQYVAYEYLHFD